MRRFVATVFDEWVYSTAMYTADMYEDLLGSVDRLVIQAIADAVSGSSVTLTVAYESSTDGTHWTSHGNVISGASLDALQTNVAVGGDDGSATPMRRVRLRLSLAGTTPQAQVRLIVCGRDTAKGPSRAMPSMAAPPFMNGGGPPLANQGAAPLALAPGSAALAPRAPMPPGTPSAAPLRVTKRTKGRPT